jgi:hypothetical protein
VDRQVGQAQQRPLDAEQAIVLRAGGAAQHHAPGEAQVAIGKSRQDGAAVDFDRHPRQAVATHRRRGLSRRPGESVWAPTMRKPARAKASLADDEGDQGGTAAHHVMAFRRLAGCQRAASSQRREAQPREARSALATACQGLGLASMNAIRSRAAERSRSLGDMAEHSFQ